MPSVIIVEGKHDRDRLLQVLQPDVIVLCTFGIPTEERMQMIRQTAAGADVYIFTDNDWSGRRIRGILSEEFPEAIHIHTRKEYREVENTPSEYLLFLMEKHELI